mmetsp:Transcript_112861/g.364494  ORF Transcript_112861/g.364494 Transcript_112861/m.364494 type:complete len:98 (+) Transcript_112861:518-811(+)
MRRLVRDKSICSSPGAEQGDVSIVESSTFDARTLLEAKCSSLGSPQSLPALVLGPLSLSRMHPELFADDSEFLPGAPIRLPHLDVGSQSRGPRSGQR